MGFMEDMFFGTTKVNVDVNKNLFASIRKNRLNDMKSYFIENPRENVDKYKDDYGNTLLHISIHYGRLDFFKYLLEKNSSLEIKNDIDSTPLHFLMRKCNKDLLKLYLDHINSTLIKELQTLRQVNDTTNANINTLKTKYRDSVIAIDKLEIEKRDLKQSNSELNENNKRMRIEINNLEENNKKLRKEVENYISLYKNKK